MLLILAIGFITATAFFESLGGFAIKYTSAANKAVCEQGQTLFVWIFFLLYVGPGQEEFTMMKLAGFFLILIGVLFFNDILTFDGWSIRFLPEDGLLAQS